jgi:hypothetical protein
VAAELLSCVRREARSSATACRRVSIEAEKMEKRRNERFAVRDEALHLFNVDLTDRTCVGSAVHMNVHDVLGESERQGEKEKSRREIRTYSVPSFVVFILDDEDHVEPGENGGLEVDILLGSGSEFRAEYRQTRGGDGGGGRREERGERREERGERREKRGERREERVRCVDVDVEGTEER